MKKWLTIMFFLFLLCSITSAGISSCPPDLNENNINLYKSWRFIDLRINRCSDIKGSAGTWNQYCRTEVHPGTNVLACCSNTLKAAGCYSYKTPATLDQNLAYKMFSSFAKGETGIRGCSSVTNMVYSEVSFDFSEYEMSKCSDKVGSYYFVWDENCASDSSGTANYGCCSDSMKKIRCYDYQTPTNLVFHYLEDTVSEGGNIHYTYHAENVNHYEINQNGVWVDIGPNSCVPSCLGGDVGEPGVHTTQMRACGGPKKSEACGEIISDSFSTLDSSGSIPSGTSTGTTQGPDSGSTSADPGSSTGSSSTGSSSTGSSSTGSSSTGSSTGGSSTGGSSTGGSSTGSSSTGGSSTGTSTPASSNLADCPSDVNHINIPDAYKFTDLNIASCSEIGEDSSFGNNYCLNQHPSMEGNIFACCSDEKRIAECYSLKIPQNLIFNILNKAVLIGQKVNIQYHADNADHYEYKYYNDLDWVNLGSQDCETGCNVDLDVETPGLRVLSLRACAGKGMGVACTEKKGNSYVVFESLNQVPSSELSIPTDFDFNFVHNPIPEGGDIYIKYEATNADHFEISIYNTPELNAPQNPIGWINWQKTNILDPAFEETCRTEQGCNIGKMIGFSSLKIKMRACAGQNLGEKCTESIIRTLTVG